MNPKSLLDRYGLEPKKSLGQNFIHDYNILEKIVSHAEVTAEDRVLEIGPGTGTLTEVLARHAKQVVAVELDTRLEPILLERLAPYDNVQLTFGDILETDVVELMGDYPYMVVANVPYYITSAILRHLLEAKARPRRLILTVQSEVADRLLAKPGDLSLLAVSVQYYARPRIVMRLNPGVFYPRPDVASAVVRLDVYDQQPIAVPDTEKFFEIVRAGFGQKRKQLKNSLAEGLHMADARVSAWMTEADIDPRRRAETLSLEEWAALARTYPVS